MTKLISILIVLVVIFVGYRLYVYWEKVESERDIQEERARKHPFDPKNLPGMPWTLEQSWEQASKAGVSAMSNWFALYGSRVEDPRLAWIQLDYCLKLALVNPRDARELFALVKDRTPTNSPVYPRIKQLENTFQ